MTERWRRCSVLFLEPREQLDFDPSGLLQGRLGLTARVEWIALAPHLGSEVTLSEAEVVALGRIGETLWLTEDRLTALADPDVVRSLRQKGLLVCDSATGNEPGARDAVVRDTYWRPIAAVMHMFTRWHFRDAEVAEPQSRFGALEDMVRAYGPPPAHFHARSDAVAVHALPSAQALPGDEVLARRVTCRNFDGERDLSLASMATLLHRVFGAQGLEEVAEGASAIKKNSPSGGALHPIEAYVLVRGVEGLAIGLYHYHVGTHALHLLRELAPDEANRLSLLFVAGQEYFAQAPVLVAMCARFRRSFWKYRNHGKAWRALQLETGHLSQNLYLAATELGLGAFVTAAINDADIEDAFRLDPLQEGPMAVSGFGFRGKRRETVEFDPNEKVWSGR